MDALGGYLSLEMPRIGRLKENVFASNSGRAGLELILAQRGYRHLHLPEYICPVVFRKMDEMGIHWTTYRLDASLEVADEIPRLEPDSCLVYVNYFGVKDDYCHQITKVHSNIILDLTQAFFYEPLPGIDAFSSFRKFFGVPDGGYVFGQGFESLKLDRMAAWPYCEHLVRRLDGDTGGGYQAFKKNDEAVTFWPPRQISKLSESIMASIDIESKRTQRLSNFRYLASALDKCNELKLSSHSSAGPLCYPLLHPEGERIRKKLIEKKVFTPTYWPGIDEWVDTNHQTKAFVKNLVSLPVDQRYDLDDMERIVQLLHEFEVNFFQSSVIGTRQGAV